MTCDVVVADAGNVHQLLLRTVEDVLVQAQNLGVKSLALPLIGAGRGRWPPAMAARIQISAVVQFAKWGLRGPFNVSTRTRSCIQVVHDASLTCLIAMEMSVLALCNGVSNIVSGTGDS